ncbi:alpha/beta hydrolase (plasmid) [Novosphingobium sp. BL-8A]|uniref:alpha/beta hydrolase family protein n=1 Tax=Novosphingobium sp. BL-8A TaxID=3127639 RepID=UPI003756EEAC
MKSLILPILLILTGAAPPAENCAVGSYLLSDGTIVDIAAGEGDHLRWRRPDGTTGELTEMHNARWKSTLGWTGRPDGNELSFDCARHQMIFNRRRGNRIAFDVTDTTFEVNGAVLAGRLVMPKGKQRVPLVILVHGAEHSSALQSYSMQRMFPASGIGAFVYDKRGTGASSGQYTQDYATLATDAIAALHAARKLGGDRISRVGYQGASQGGWVAPLAARIEPVDFVIVSFGLAVSVADAEHELITAQLTRRGYGPEEVSKAMEISRTVETLIDSNFQSGYDQLSKVRARYGSEAWFHDVRGSAVGIILDMPEGQLRREGPSLAPNISIYYDPLPVLRNLTVPQLWLLAQDDETAPSNETEHRLSALAQSGRPITTAVFPGTDHGMYRYELAPDGTRLSTRAPDGYFGMMRDFVMTGRVRRNYGARLVNPPRTADE